MFDVVLALAALFGLCAFLVLHGKLHSALAPLTALGLIGVWLTLAGVAGLLVPGGWVLYAACYGLGGWALPRRLEKAVHARRGAVLCAGCGFCGVFRHPPAHPHRF